MSFTAKDIANMRAKRAARIAAARAQARGERPELLLTEHLAPKSALWWPSKTTVIDGRIVDFMVTQENNVGGNVPGDFVGVREIAIHRTPGGKSFVCPRNYGKECRCCDTYHEHYDELKSDRKHWAHKFKSQKIAIFNMLKKEENGSVSMVVVRASRFFSIAKINAKLELQVKLHPDKVDEIYAYSDIEIGYWINMTFSEAAAVDGNKDEYMQIVEVTPNISKPFAIPEKVYPLITDLDKLIPACPSAEEIDEMFGFEDEKQVGDAIDDEIDLGTAGSKASPKAKQEADENDLGGIDGLGDLGIEGATALVDTEVIEDVIVDEEKPKAEAKAKAEPKAKAAKPKAESKAKVEEKPKEEAPDTDDGLGGLPDADSTEEFDPLADFDDFDNF